MIARWSLAVVAAMLALMIAGSAYAWTVLPDGASIPVHFNAAGEADRYGGKAEALLMMPGVLLLVTALIFVVAKIEPRQKNLAQSRAILAWTLAGTSVFMGAIHGVTILAALGRDVSVPLVVGVGIGLLFMLIGNFLPKSRSNFMVGIRTPWTLSSDHSWRLTHLWGGRAFVALGLAILVAAVAAPAASVWLTVAGTLAVVIGLTAFSWLLWRADPEAHRG